MAKAGKTKNAVANEESNEKPEPEEGPENAEKKSKKKMKKAAAAKESNENPEDGVEKTGETSNQESKHKDGASKKGAKDESGGKKGGSDSKKDGIVQEAVQVILKGIAAPEAQKDGKAFVPNDWHTKYKDQLGPYKKFLQKHPDKFALIEDGAGHFIIKKPEDVDPNEKKQAPKLINGKTWQKMLMDAWLAYCLAVPRDTRSFEQFIGTLPNGVRNGKPAPATSAPEKKGTKRSADVDSDKAADEADADKAMPTKTKKQKKRADCEEAGDETAAIDDTSKAVAKKTKKQKSIA